LRDRSDGLFGSAFEEVRVVGNVDGEETHRENGETLRVGDLK
jgi:hypothetical protein